MKTMAFTIEKILNDAKLLCTRLKDHDMSAESLLEQAHTMNKKVEAMQTYQENLNELNQIAKHRPRANLIMGLVQENTQIRELQQENKELKLALEEHQSALELIMRKYREQVIKLVMVSKLDRSAHSIESSDKSLEASMEKICEMAAVMKKAIAVDEESTQQTHETITRLKHENMTLRQLLNMAAINIPKPATCDEGVQTNEWEDSENQNIGMDDSYTSTDTSYENPLHSSVIEVLPSTKEIITEDENANSSNASSDLDTEIAKN